MCALARHLLKVSALLMVAVFFTVSCKDSEVKKSTPRKGALDKSQLCASGGATYDAVGEECICHSSQRWDGGKCESDSKTISSKEVVCNAGAGTWEPEGAVCSCPEPLTWNGSKCEAESKENEPGEAEPEETEPEETEPEETTTVTAHSEFDYSKVKTACVKAKGRWYPDEGYCFCAEGTVLVGKQCVSLNGRLTAGICRGVVYPGKWISEQCQCPYGAETSNDDAVRWIFSLARGGCAPAKKATETMLRRICESSLNRGKWDTRNQRCLCPQNRIWDAEVCKVQGELRSRQVCESDYNKGAWDSADKHCICKLGYLWIDQQCRLMTSVSNKEACQSEFNKGSWSERLNTCICPGISGWAPAMKACLLPRT